MVRSPIRPPVRPVLRGVLAGAGVLLGLLLLLAAASALFGWIGTGPSGRPSLRSWLVLEILGGAAAGTLAGWVARRVAGHDRGATLLAALVLTLGFLEAAIILRFGPHALAETPGWLVLLAPPVGAVAVLLGGALHAGTSAWGRVVSALGARREMLRYAAPVLVLGAAAILSRLVLPGLEGTRLEVMSVALTLDFTLAVPAVVYWLFVRAKRAPWLVLLPSFAAGYALAKVSIPPAQQGALDAGFWILALAELVLIGHLAMLAHRTLRGAAAGAGDFATRFRSAARRVLAHRVPADILATEVAIPYFAFRPHRNPPRAADEYTVHEEVAYATVVLGLVLLLVVETIALHAFASRWGPTPAWILTGLSAYALMWLVGDYRAVVARPTRIGPTHLSLRVGLRWEAELPLALVERADRLPAAPGARGPETVAVALLGQPNVALRLRAPVRLTGMYGIERPAREIWLHVDRSERFLQALEEAIAADVRR